MGRGNLSTYVAILLFETGFPFSRRFNSLDAQGSLLPEVPCWGEALREMAMKLSTGATAEEHDVDEFIMNNEC